MRIGKDLTSYLFHLTSLHMVDVTDGEAGDAGDMGGLLAVAIEQDRH